MRPEQGRASAPVLVIGADGQVGRAILRHQRLGARAIMGLTRQDLDLEDLNGAREQITGIAPSVVINAAAYTAVDKAESEQERAFAVNRDAPGHLAAICDALDVPLLHISTDYVFDGRKTGPYLEDDPIAPMGVYGASKAAGEALVRERHGRHVILRTAWVYAPYGTNFVRTILRLSAERPTLRVVDDQVGGPTPASAIADALLAIAADLNPDDRRWGTYHFCGTPSTSWCGFARAIVDAARVRGGAAPSPMAITTADYPTPARRPANSVLDCTKIKTAFGLVQPDWRQELPQCVAALMSNSTG